MTAIKNSISYFIQLPSGKYFVDGWKNITETRLIDFAQPFYEQERAENELKRLEKGAKIIKRTRIALQEIGGEIEGEMEGTELERKYLVANLGDYFISDGKPAYAFVSTNGSANYLFGANLMDLESATKLAKKLEKEAFESEQKRIQWEVIEIATMEEEVTSP